MTKIKILLTSVLKPVNDTRMYEKIGMTLAKIDNAEIHIAGFAANNSISHKNIEFYPLFNFSRLHPIRLICGWKIFKLSLKVKPEVIICNTHELLIVTVINRILFGAKIIYDVQENYFKNLWFGRQFPYLIRHFLALFVRSKERILCPFFQAFLLAEKSFEKEMPFLAGKAQSVENKFKSPEIFKIPEDRVKTPLRLLYTGTISEIYGIFDAIRVSKDLLEEKEGIFKIVGYCPDQNVLAEIKAQIEKDKRIVLIGGDKLLSHELIVEEILNSNLGIISYKHNLSILNRIPTRIYEYIACRLPFIFPEHSTWKDMASHYNAGIPINYNSYRSEDILETFLSTSFYQSQPGDEIFFDSEESKLQSLVKKFVKF